MEEKPYTERANNKKKIEKPKRLLAFIQNSSKGISTFPSQQVAGPTNQIKRKKQRQKNTKRKKKTQNNERKDRAVTGLG